MSDQGAAGSVQASGRWHELRSDDGTCWVSRLTEPADPPDADGYRWPETVITAKYANDLEAALKQAHSQLEAVTGNWHQAAEWREQAEAALKQAQAERDHIQHMEIAAAQVELKAHDEYALKLLQKSDAELTALRAELQQAREERDALDKELNATFHAFTGDGPMCDSCGRPRTSVDHLLARAEQAEAALTEAQRSLAYVDVWIQSLDGTGLSEQGFKDALPALVESLGDQAQSWLEHQHELERQLTEARGEPGLWPEIAGDLRGRLTQSQLEVFRLRDQLTKAQGKAARYEETLRWIAGGVSADPETTHEQP